METMYTINLCFQCVVEGFLKDDIEVFFLNDMKGLLDNVLLMLNMIGS